MRFFTALFMLMLAFAGAAQAEVLNGETPLKDGELSELCGGFSLGNGMVLNVGIDNTVSLNGAVIGNSSLSINGNTVTSSTTGVTRVAGNGGVTTVQMATNGSTLIANTASNITLAQARTVNIDMSSVARQAFQSISMISAIQSQAINSMKNGLH